MVFQSIFFHLKWKNALIKNMLMMTIPILNYFIK